MHDILFYRDPNGNEPILDYLRKVSRKNDKDSRVKLRKIQDYIKILSQYGTQAGEPYLKHLIGDIWELRPLKDRILFVGWTKGDYVLLHCFVKKTKKTPVREIERAKRELTDLMARGISNEQ